MNRSRLELLALFNKSANPPDSSVFVAFKKDEGRKTAKLKEVEEKISHKTSSFGFLTSESEISSLLSVLFCRVPFAPSSLTAPPSPLRTLLYPRSRALSVLPAPRPERDREVLRPLINFLFLLLSFSLLPSPPIAALASPRIHASLYRSLVSNALFLSSPLLFPHLSPLSPLSRL